jgi:gliding motility-associated-like protein
MNKLYKIVALLIFFLIKAGVSTAQIDTLFYFAPPWVTPDHDRKNPVIFHISSFSSPQTTVHISQPASPLSMDTTFVMGPGQLVDITYWRGALASPTSLGYDSLETRPADVVRTNGVRIRSSARITVVYDVVTVTPNNPETYSLKGQNALGMEFVCPFQTKWNNIYLQPPRDNNGDGITTQPKSQINIVATRPNTVVWITPRCPVVGVNGTRPANVTYSIMLPFEGTCYTVENITRLTSVPGQNLSGTIITSDKPVAVTVSDDSVNPGSGSGQTCYDQMGDQIVPVDLVGTEYIVNRGQLNNQTGEAFFVVATQNFTKIEIVGATTTTVLLNKGDTYTHDMNNNLTYVKADKDVYLLSASGYGCELGEALLPPLNCAGSDSVTFTRNNSNPFFLNVLCKAAAISNFTLTNSSSTMLLSPSQFTPIPVTATLSGGPYYGAQLGPFTTAQIPVNSSNLLYNSSGSDGFFAMGVFNGTSTGGALFHYMSSFLRRTQVKTATVSPVCAGQGGTIAVTGTVSGADIAGVWTTSHTSGSVTVHGGGTGTFSPVYTSSLNTISTVYSLSVNDTTSFSSPTKTITLYLTSVGSCKSVTDSVKLEINQRPRVLVSTGTTMCKNNILPVVLSGTVTNAVSGAWSGGNGGVFGAPGLVTTYTPSQADLAANTITLSLSSQAPLPGCPNTVETLTVGFINPPVVTIVPNNTVVCTNSRTLALNGNISGVTTTGIWLGGTGAYTLNNTSPTATYILSPNDLTQSGLTLTLSSTNNGICASESATMQISVIQKPVLTLPPDFTVCAGAGIALLTGTVEGSATQGIWSSGMANGVFSNQQVQSSPVNTTYSLSALDTNFIYFVLESAPGMCPVEKDSVRVSILSAPVVRVNEAFTPVCRNAQIALTGTVSGYTSTGIWSTSSNTSNPGSFMPDPNFLHGFYIPSETDIENGFVILTLTSTNNQQCPASSSAFTASFIPSPTARFSFSPKRCVNTPVLFHDESRTNGTAFLKWDWDFGDNNPIGGSSAANPIKTYTVAQQYVVTLTVTGVSLLNVSCQDVWDTLIRIKPLPIAAFKVAPACQEFPVVFTNQSIAPPGSDPIVMWKWEFGDSIQHNVPPLITGVPTTTVSHAYASAERFSAFLTVTATPAGASPSLGCVSDPHREYVDVFAKPKAEFGLTNNPSVVQEPVYFSDFSTPVGNIAQWFWEFGDEGASVEQAPVHTYQQAGIFSIKLTVIDFAGCRDTLRKDIDVTLLPQVPSGFTPNGDGVNDYLHVKGGPFENMIFRVYNNWGELVWETADQSLGWDGRKNGIDQPVGVYVWTLVVDMYNNRQVKKNGDVTLIR